MAWCVFVNMCIVLYLCYCIWLLLCTGFKYVCKMWRTSPPLHGMFNSFVKKVLCIGKLPIVTEFLLSLLSVHLSFSIDACSVSWWTSLKTAIDNPVNRFSYIKTLTWYTCKCRVVLLNKLFLKQWLNLPFIKQIIGKQLLHQLVIQMLLFEIIWYRH